MTDCLLFFTFLSDIFSTPFFSCSCSVFLAFSPHPSPLQSSLLTLSSYYFSSHFCLFFHLPLSPLSSSSSIHKSIHHFSLCYYTTFFPHALGYSSPSSSILTWFHLLINPLICLSSPQPCHRNMIFTGALSSTSVDLSCLIPTCLSPFFSFLLILIIIHQYSFISCIRIYSPPPPPLLFLLICLSSCHVLTFFPYSHLVTVFTHQTVFIFLSLCRVIYSILSPSFSSF